MSAAGPGNHLHLGRNEGGQPGVKGIALARQAADPALNRVVISAVEHPPWRNRTVPARFHGFAVDVVPVDSTGLVTRGARGGTPAGDGAGQHHVRNNEVGTVQPVATLADLARAPGHSLPHRRRAGRRVAAAGHQGAGRGRPEHLRPQTGAPKGCGVLYVRGRTRMRPLLHGGGQERGRRSGTENVAGAVGLATALTLAQTGQRRSRTTWRALRDGFIGAVLAGGSRRRPDRPPSERLPSVASFCFPGTSGESVLLDLERQGVVCSSGSACAAGFRRAVAGADGHGFPAEVAQTAVRFSFDSTVSGADLARRRGRGRPPSEASGPSAAASRGLVGALNVAALTRARVPRPAENPVPQQREPDGGGQETWTAWWSGARRPRWRPDGASAGRRGCRR